MALPLAIGLCHPTQAREASLCCQKIVNNIITPPKLDPFDYYVCGADERETKLCAILKMNWRQSLPTYPRRTSERHVGGSNVIWSLWLMPFAISLNRFNVQNLPDICLCLPPDRTWHKVNDTKVDYNEGLGRGSSRTNPRSSPAGHQPT